MMMLQKKKKKETEHSMMKEIMAMPSIAQFDEHVKKDGAFVVVFVRKKRKMTQNNDTEN